MKKTPNERMIQIWQKVVLFVKWCEDHRIPEMIIEAIIKIAIYLLTK